MPKPQKGALPKYLQWLYQVGPQSNYWLGQKEEQVPEVWMANGHVAKAPDPNIFVMIARWRVYTGHTSHFGKVMLKPVPVHLHNGMRTMDVFILERLDPYFGVTDPQGHIQTSLLLARSSYEWCPAGWDSGQHISCHYGRSSCGLMQLQCWIGCKLSRVKSRYLLALRLQRSRKSLKSANADMSPQIACTYFISTVHNFSEIAEKRTKTRFVVDLCVWFGGTSGL